MSDEDTIVTEEKRIAKKLIERYLVSKCKGAIYNQYEIEGMSDKELNYIALSASGHNNDRWVSLETTVLIRTERIKRGILLPNGKRNIKGE